MTISTPQSPIASADLTGSASQNEDAFADLARALSGSVALPEDPVYLERATPWNVSVATAPDAVVIVADAADVAATVRFAADHGLRVSVQCTGHGIVAAAAGPALSGTLLVHTAGLDECIVSPDGTARVGAGVKMQTLVDVAAAHGLAPVVGSTLDVGVVGFLTGGGHGPFLRAFGVASDRVTAIEVVTADGRLRRVTAQQDADLFWGLRGGKGALGIITAVELDLVRLSNFYGGALYFDGADRLAVLHAWRSWAATLPNSCTTSIAVLQLPPMPGVPAPLAGRLSIAVRYTCLEATTPAEQLLAPMRSVAPVILDGVGDLAFPAVAVVHADPVDPIPAYERSALLAELPEQAVEIVARHAAAGSPLLMAEIRQLGGAAVAPGDVPSAVCHRNAEFNFLCVGIDVPPTAEAVRSASAALLTELAPWSTGGQLPNFGGSGSPYDRATLDRLHELVRRYDPRSTISGADALP